MALKPAQIDETTHRRLKTVSDETGLPIYILIKNVCNGAFVDPARFGFSQSVVNRVRKKLAEE